MSKQKENDEFGQRMKSYELDKRLNPFEPSIVRIDGRAFSTFTKGLKKPFDPAITDNMIEATKYLLLKTHAKIGYTQSDEITLVFDKFVEGEEVPSLIFDGRVQKLCSVLASMATSRFVFSLPLTLKLRFPHFDARAFNVPSHIEATNNVLWRAMDAKKNAISMVAQSHFSHKELQNKDQTHMLEMLRGKGIEMDQFAPHLRYGAFIQKRLITRILTDEEQVKIPEKFRPTEPVVRSEYKIIEMPPFNTVKNRVEVIFEGVEPIV